MKIQKRCCVNPLIANVPFFDIDINDRANRLIVFYMR